jgi:hypothetical protein
MLRVRLFAATIVMGAVLAGCSSSGSMSGLFKPSPPPPQVLEFDSQPPGANVQTAQGQTCITPCSLGVPVMSQAVSFSMNGFIPQSIPLTVDQPKGSLFSSPPPVLVPNPVVATLQAVPPPPRKVVKPRPRPRKMVARPRPVAPRPASAQPSIAAPEPAPQQNVFPPPPPMNSPSEFPPPQTR